MKSIEIFTEVGSFAEDKDRARGIRLNEIIPALDQGGEVILDFNGVDGTTQAFIHALISDLIRKYGIEVLDRLSFKNCNDVVRQIISIVADYMQDGEE